MDNIFARAGPEFPLPPAQRHHDAPTMGVVRRLRVLSRLSAGASAAPAPQLVEVQLVNAIAPFVLNARLKPLMLAVPTPDKHIVHVSAMEGQFYRSFKTTRHPHTNMAKAALNMMTRTSAADYAKTRIYMTAVDTGWINDENPLEKAQRVFKTHHFQTPIDEIDAAARIIDPVVVGLNDGELHYGVFFKDYRLTEW